MAAALPARLNDLVPAEPKEALNFLRVKLERRTFPSMGAPGSIIGILTRPLTKPSTQLISRFYSSGLCWRYIGASTHRRIVRKFGYLNHAWGATYVSVYPTVFRRRELASLPGSFGYSNEIMDGDSVGLVNKIGESK
jgi:hypothetical protein